MVIVWLEESLDRWKGTIVMNASNRFGIETIARQRQAEISRELVTRQLFRNARENMSRGGKSASLALRMSPVFILAFLLLYFLH